MLEEVVTATLEMQLHLQLATCAMPPAPIQTDASIVVGIACFLQCDSITDVLKQLVECMETTLPSLVHRGLAMEEDMLP